jgi:hypothetical protein
MELPMRHRSLRDKFFVSNGRTMLFLLLLSAGTALADDVALLRCRAIADAAARLACYDALPMGSTEGKTGQAKPIQTPEQFGLEPQLAAAQAPVELDAIDSRVSGRFEGWYPNAIIRLANGQTWQVTDGSSRSYDVTDPKVSIRRGFLGAFYLNIDGDNRTVRVKRVQ